MGSRDTEPQGNRETGSIKQERELTLLEEQELKDTSRLLENLNLLETWITNNILPLYEEVEAGQASIKPGNVDDVIEELVQDRKKLARAIKTNNQTLLLKNYKPGSQFAIFANKLNPDIQKIIPSLVIEHPNEFHPLNVKNYLTKLTTLKAVATSFELFLKTPKRGDGGWQRQIEVNIKKQSEEKEQQKD